MPPAPRPTPFTPRPTPFAPKPAPVAPESATILAPLAALSENWPEALRMEIAQMNLANAQVALPVNLVEPALKRGRVIFAWRNLRSWIKPTSTAVSVHDGLELELPLKIVAPLFLARLGGAARTGSSASIGAASGGDSEFVFWFSAAATVLRNPGAAGQNAHAGRNPFRFQTGGPPTTGHKLLYLG